MPDQSIIAAGPQPERTDESLSGLAKVGALGTLLAASGFVPYRSGQRMWDAYVRGIRNVETLFPSAILRTFRVSEMLSPLETWSKLSIPTAISEVGGVYSQYLRNVLGPITGEVQLARTGRIFGEISVGGVPVGMGLQIEAGTQRGAAIADYYARITGTKMSMQQSLGDALLRAEYKTSGAQIPYKEWLENLTPAQRRRRLVLGARYREKISIFGKDIALSEEARRTVAKVETIGQLMRAKAAATAGRLNTLLAKPLDVPIVGGVLKRIPLLRSLAVEPGTATQMMWRYTKKGLAVAGAWKALEYYDYLRAKDSPWATVLGTLGGGAAGAYFGRRTGYKFSPRGGLIGAGIGLYTALAPRFDQGLFHGFASYFTDLNIARAGISEAAGLSESLREQEEVTPGLISLKTAIAFGGIGALGAGLASYGKFLGNTFLQRSTAGTLTDVADKIRQEAAKRPALGMLSKLPGGKALSRIKSPMALGFIGGVATWAAVSSAISLLSGNIGAAIPGINLLGTTETPEELEAIYSGEQEIPVGRGRGWEFGRSAYEGSRPEYFRPHFMARLRDRLYQKGIWESEEEKWAHDPWLHPLKTLFGPEEWKYHYEIKHQYDRPAPLTGTIGGDVPFIGSAVAATFGKLIKPRKMARPEEWNLPGGLIYPPDPEDLEPAYELGGLAPGAPVSPEDMTQLLNELNYRRREAVGLVGFAEGAIEKALTGREEVFPNLMTMGTMGRETGSEYWLWSHLNLGGAAGLSEAVRRFIPRTRSYLERYNPIENQMPSWLPRDYFLDFFHGNVFEKFKEAELRLPGPGYAARFPELEGVHPEDYPLVHRLKILGSVAYYSNEYKRTLSEAKRNFTKLSDYERKIVRDTEEQVKAQKQRRVLTEYRFRPELLEEQEVTVTEVLDSRRIRTRELGEMTVELQGVGATKNMADLMEFARSELEGKQISLRVPAMESRRYDLTQRGSRMKAVAMLGETDYGAVLAGRGLAEPKPLKDEFEQLRFAPREQLAGKISETILHGVETPLEYLTPISPASKLIRQRSAIEEYVAAEAYATQSAFWDKPIENFLKPAADMTLKKMGFDNIPQQIQERRSILEYFDMLAWVKAKKLEDKAVRDGQYEQARAYKEQQQQTLFGADVFGSPVNILKAMPRRERDFFQAFSEAKTQQERQEIFDMVPENERRVYASQWLRQEEKAARAKKAAGIATKEDEQLLVGAQMMRRSEGFGITPELEKQWLEETGGEIPYDEWIRQKKAEEYFATRSLPGPEWLAWSPSVDLEDVKLKYVESLGKNIHDFDLWNPRKAMLARKPYIDDKLIEEIDEQSDIDKIAKTKANAEAMGRFHKAKDTNVLTEVIGANIDEVYDIEIVDARDNLIRDAHKILGAGR